MEELEVMVRATRGGAVGSAEVGGSVGAGVDL